jgi:AmmeMemoRadiSam system protein B/AmmeMemoRadiSam system protein A
MIADEIRRPAIAGTFYPAEASALTTAVESYLDAARVTHSPSKAIVAPHAGFIYSGPIAGTVYASLRPLADRIRRVVMIGPAHRVAFRGLAVPGHRAWRTPLGDVALDRTAVDRIAGLPDVRVLDAAHEEEHCLEVQLPFLQRLLGDFTIVPVLAGQAGPVAIERVLRELWGGTETLVVISSDLSHYHDYAAAQRLDRDATLAIECLRPDNLVEEQACGRIPIKGLLARARDLDMRATAIDLRNSGDTAGSRDRVVGYGGYGFEYARSARLSDAHRRTLIGLGRDVLAQSAARRGRKPVFAIGELPPQLTAARATFVTLKIDGKLRGCVGSVTAKRALALDVADNAYKSAYSDPRFDALTAEELDRIDLGVSILSSPRPVKCRTEDELIDQLHPDHDGLILSEGDKRSLFLPQVWSSLADPRTFVRHLKAKAGLGEDHWSDGIKAYRFSTESFGTAEM